MLRTRGFIDFVEDSQALEELQVPTLVIQLVVDSFNAVVQKSKRESSQSSIMFENEFTAVTGREALQYLEYEKQLLLLDSDRNATI